jgi:hypothetical protein
MSTNTSNFNLIKPELTDPADITSINPNWDIIDESLQARLPLDGSVPMSGGSISLRNGIGKLTVGDTFTQLESYKSEVGDTGNRRVLALNNGNDIKNALQIADWTDGTSAYYKIYHQGNKPSPTDIGAATTASYTGTLTANGWSSSAPYTQTISVSGILATDTPFVDVYLESASDGASIIEAWAVVSRVSTANNSVTAYCYEEKPTINIPIILKVVR